MKTYTPKSCAGRIESLPTLRFTRPWFIAIAAFALVLGCGEPEPEPEPDPRPNIILISMDTVRADHLGSYGHSRDTTPQLDAFAARATRFHNAYAPGPWTYTSHIQMLTGQSPQEIGVYISDLAIPDAIPIFSEYLSRAGYQTVAMVDSPGDGYVGANRGFGRGFDEYRHAPHQKGMPFDYDAEVTFAETARWIEREWHREKPFALFLHTKTAHKIKEEWAHEDYRNPPYDQPSDRFRFVTPEQAEYSWQDSKFGNGGALLGALSHAYLHKGVDPASFDREKLEVLERLYDGSIYRIDRGFGDLVSFLRSEGLYDRTLIIVTSDHGEEFLEHGQFGHGQLYQEITRIPLIVKFPHEDTGRVVDQNVDLADIVPTILKFAQIEIPSALGGVTLDDHRSPIDPERPIFGAHYKPRGPNSKKKQLLSLRRGDWTLISWSIKKTGKHGVELYDRSRDLEQLHPITDQPERVAAMRAELEAWHASWLPLGAKNIHIDEATREHLRALGYME